MKRYSSDLYLIVANVWLAMAIGSDPSIPSLWMWVVVGFWVALWIVVRVGQRKEEGHP